MMVRLSTLTPCSSSILRTILEGFFNNEAHSYQICSGLFDEVDNAQCGISVCEKVIHEKNIVVRGEEICTDNDFIITVFGE